MGVSQQAISEMVREIEHYIRQFFVELHSQIINSIAVFDYEFLAFLLHLVLFFLVENAYSVENISDVFQVTGLQLGYLFFW